MSYSSRPNLKPFMKLYCLITGSRLYGIEKLVQETTNYAKELSISVSILIKLIMLFNWSNRGHAVINGAPWDNREAFWNPKWSLPWISFSDSFQLWLLPALSTPVNLQPLSSQQLLGLRHIFSFLSCPFHPAFASALAHTPRLKGGRVAAKCCNWTRGHTLWNCLVTQSNHSS